tara:strand:- start:558 stop:959 length:402 start_codon:yes stop_codon:yes gene_type:complete
MIGDALRSLDINDYVLVAGVPTNETDFLNSFRKVVGKDATNTAILSSDPSKFGVTWTQIAPKIAELQAAEPMRLMKEQRNIKLAETDWWSCSDLTMTQSQKDYRQALRDLPATAEPKIENRQLTNVTWPEKPE